MYDGDVIDLGGRELEAIALPGHTPGSMALLDRQTGRLYSGDSIQDGRIFMFGPMRNLPAYILGLRRLSAMKERITEIYPSHASCPVPPSLIDELIAGAERLERGECEYTLAEMHGNRVRLYDIGAASMLCEDRD